VVAGQRDSPCRRQVDARLRISTVAHHIAQAHELERLVPFREIDRGLQRFQVAVDVGNEEVSHRRLRSRVYS
jgi:hypothetical protein